MLLSEDQSKRSVFQIAESETVKPAESLEVHRSRMMLSVVNESRSRLKQSMKAISQKEVQEDWKALISGRNYPRTGQLGPSESGVIAAKGSQSMDKQHVVYQKFANVIQQANFDLYKGSFPPLSSLLAAALQEIPNNADSPVDITILKNVFEMISAVLDSSGVGSEERMRIMELQNPSQIRQLLIDQSLRYLSLRYSREVDHQVSTSLLRTNRSKPLEKLESFTLRALANRLNDTSYHFSYRLPSGAPFWAVVFFALRSGNKSAVVQLLSDAIRNDSFPQSNQHLSRLSSFIDASHDSTMIIVSEKLLKLRDARLRCEEDYYSLLRSKDVDPFQLAVYLVVCQLEPFQKLSREIKHAFSVWIYPTIFDYLWLRVSGLFKRFLFIFFIVKIDS